MRAAIYARYSSENQREASIEDQVRLCRMRIEREGWALTATYTDSAISGATRLRPGYQKLLADARDGQFEVIVAEALDRLSRDQEDVAGLYKQLAFAGVKLVTLAEGEINELHVGLKGTMNALFLKDLAAKTWRGLEGRVRQGRSGGGLCYGYDVVRQAGPDGVDTGARRINEAEAAVVRRIFAEFAAGRSPRRIARQLNADGVPGPGGRPWSDTTIRGHATRRTGILHNDLYAGRLIWNRQRYLKDPTTGRRLARPNPEDHWIVREVPELRILPQELWDQVRARLDRIRQSPMVRKARTTRFWEHRRPVHLLTGLARCGVCNGPIVGIGRHYLGCSHARRRGTCANRRSMPRAALENLILDALRHNLMQPDLVKAFIAAYHDEINQTARHQAQQRRQTEAELEATNRKLGQLIDAIADGFRSPGLQAKLADLECHKAGLERQMQTPPPAPVRLHPNLAELYRQRVAALHQALADPATRDEALGLVRGLIEAVVLHPADDGFAIEIVGDIAGMVAVANPGSKKAASGCDAALVASSRKVVAGRGFEPLTFRL